MALTFNGVFQPPNALPGFWIFMYRVSPLTYSINGIVAAGLADREIHCSQKELSIFPPPAGQTCSQYLAPYLAAAPGTLSASSANSMTRCEYCALSNTDQILASDNIFYDQRWRNFGIVWAYVIFNIAAAILLYYLFRVRKVSLKGTLTGWTSVFRRKGAEASQDKPTPEEKKPENPALV